MTHTRLSLLSTLVVAFLSGCPEPTPITNTVTVTVIQDCAPGAPNGKCEAGNSCVDGACVASATLCSPTNEMGACGSGTTCFAGGCVVTAKLCSATSPTGPCDTGNSCMAGRCVALASLCSSANLMGSCPQGQVCQGGLCGTVPQDVCLTQLYTTQPTIGVDTRAKLMVDGKEFKDNNGSGALDPYEDWRLAEACRARDLVSRMTVPQRIGLLSEGSTIGGGTADGVLAAGTISNIQTLHLRQALIRLGARSGRELAVYLNNVQKLTESLPHGIPFVVTADPVHGFGLSTNATTGVQTLSAPTVVSPWPYPMGLGAANDLTLTRLYGDTVRREFMGMGFRWQLGPMADLATEPRWARVQNTFGENAHAVGNHTRACIEAFQAQGQGGLKSGIAATIKHFPGAGANEDGMDSHSRPGRYNVYPGNYFEYHQVSFRAAFTAQPAAVMPCYSIFRGQLDYNPEQAGAAFSRGLITNYMKEALGFSGMVTSDWGTIGGTSWGVESLTPQQRAAQFLRAGSHQFGSDSVTVMQQAFDQGLVTEAEINVAAEKVLEMSFKLGLFENPYVNPDASAAEVRSVANRTAGFVAQKKAIVLLKNREHTTTANSGAKYLPIDGARKATDGGTLCDADRDGTVEVFFDGVVDSLAGSDIYDDALQAYDYKSATSTQADGGVVLAIAEAASPAAADIAVLRISARKGTYFGLDRGVPLSWDAPFTGTQTDGSLASSVKDARKVIDLLRVRDGYTDSTGAVVAATNPNLKIVLVVHFDRPGIVKPFVNGLVSLNETLGTPGSYPLVSDNTNIRTDGLGGVDVLVAEFGAFDRAVLDVLFNKNAPTTPANYVYGSSRLPIEVPSSDAEVDAQFEDMPADSANPTYLIGAGSTY
ncbi:MAG: glycoside hydrolase family 3 N-terminal domain-containing protein [Myxococcales bacterium]|nr:glycoside hydrolase family 3 N-terminal domain-containing protein [Myxococcales bacterium]